MTDMLRTLLRRVVLYQPVTGTILDMPATRLLSAEPLQVEESRAQTAAGSTVARTRNHTLRLRLGTNEEARMAERMADGGGCRCMMLGAPGTQNIVWGESATLSTVPESGGALSVGAREVQLETSVFHADISRGVDLLNSVPWMGASADRAYALAPSGSTNSLPTGVSALGSKGSADSDLLGVAGSTLIVEALSGNTFINDSTNLNDAQGVAFDSISGEIYVSDRQSSSPHDLERYDSSGSHLASLTYPGPNQPKSAALAGAIDRLFVADSGGTVRVISTKGGILEAGSFTPITGGNPTALAINDRASVPDEGELYVATDGGAVEVWDWTQSPQQVLELYDGSSTAKTGLFDVIGSAFDALSLHQGMLKGLQGSTTSLQNLMPFQLSTPATATRPLRSWHVSTGAKVRLDGSDTAGISPDKPAVLHMICPAWLSTLQLASFEDGSLDAKYEARGWSGGVIDSGDATSTFEVPFKTWVLRLEVKSADKGLQLLVRNPGPPLGVAEGTATDTYDTRVSSPYWDQSQLVAK